MVSAHAGEFLRLQSPPDVTFGVWQGWKTKRNDCGRLRSQQQRPPKLHRYINLETQSSKFIVHLEIKKAPLEPLLSRVEKVLCLN